MKSAPWIRDHGNLATLDKGLHDIWHKSMKIYRVLKWTEIIFLLDNDRRVLFIFQEAVLKEMERKHLCEMLVMERLISEEKDSDLRKATQQLTKEEQQERLLELKVCVVQLNWKSP